MNLIWLLLKTSHCFTIHKHHRVGRMYLTSQHNSNLVTKSYLYHYTDLCTICYSDMEHDQCEPCSNDSGYDQLHNKSNISKEKYYIPF